MMSEQTIKLIKLINEGKTCNEICHILNISNKQLYNNLTVLQNKGFHYRRKYYSNGAIKYEPITSVRMLDDVYTSNEKSIITSPDELELKVLLISDLHYGNKFERSDLVDRAFNYCIKNDIHIIFLCGDMIDGTITHAEQYISNVYEQIEHFVKDYHFDKNILTFSVGGNHDETGLRKSGQNIIEILRNYRHDIIISNYNNFFINIKNDQIQLFHNTHKGKLIKSKSSIILHGHSHKYSCEQEKSKILHIYVPALSDLNFNQPIPTAIQMILQFDKGYIYDVYLNQIYFGDNDYILNEVKFNLLRGRHIEIPNTLNEEKERKEIFDDYTKESTIDDSKKLVKKTEGLSQIEKFNKRYGL